jgi:hypothetical protein
LADETAFVNCEREQAACAVRSLVMKRCVQLMLLAACSSSPQQPSSQPPVSDPPPPVTRSDGGAPADAELVRAEGVIATIPTQNPPACCTTFVKSSSIGNLGQVQIWKGQEQQNTKYVVLIGSGSDWRLAEPPDYIEGGECGAGHCIEQRLKSVMFANSSITKHSAPVAEEVRVTFIVAEDHYVNERGAKHDVSTHAVVVDCTLGPTLTCTDGRAVQQ